MSPRVGLEESPHRSADLAIPGGMRAPLPSPACAALVLAAALLTSRSASAYEHQWRAGASFGYMGGWNGLGQGAGGGLDVGYGVRDWLEVTAALDLSGFVSSRLLVPSGTVGLRFVFDVVQVVPYVGVQVGGAGVIAVGGGCSAACSLGKLDLELPLGADYQVSRSFTIGAGARLQVLLLDGSAIPMLGAFAKAQYAWGY
jgi:hypothetical protein